MTIPALPPIDRRLRLPVLILAGVAFAVVYFGAARLGVERAHLVKPGIVDSVVPRLEWTLWIYMSQLPYLAIVLWRAPDAACSRVLGAMAAATLVAAAVFLAYPTTVLRDDDLGQNATAFMRSLFKLVDVRTNWFPSLHVALATLATRAVPVGWWRRIAVLWAAAICLSTLTTRQHVFVDVVGGLALAGASWAIAARLPVAAEPSPAMQACEGEAGKRRGHFR